MKVRQNNPTTIVLALFLSLLISVLPFFELVAQASNNESDVLTDSHTSTSEDSPETVQNINTIGDIENTNNSKDNESVNPEANESHAINTGDAVAGGESTQVINSTDTEIGGNDLHSTSSDNSPLADTISSDATSSSTSSPSETTTNTSTDNQSESDTLMSSPDQHTSQGDEVMKEKPAINEGGLQATSSATTTTTVSVVADTGLNIATGSDMVVTTGNAIAYANVVNIVNTDIFNSAGLIAFFSEVLGMNSLDLRDAFGLFTDAAPMSTNACSESVCGNAAYSLHTQHNATITNEVNVTAQTGGNTIHGSGAIQTGDAYASANVLNIANTTVSDSKYLLLSFNNFGDYGGDIVLPGGDLLRELFTAGGAPASLQAHSTTTIRNTLDVTADTGNNVTGGGVIQTGDSTSQAGVQNIVNTNLFGGSDLLLVLRVHGDWNGSVFNLPDGVEWNETSQGIVLYNSKNGGSTQNVSTQVNAHNNATISNNVSVYALTGDNKISGEGGIKTGSSYAGAQITNIANTTVLGQNWALLIFDIFGNWNGNLSFGQPDLWIGGKATTKESPAMPGDMVMYEFTVTNNGDARASDVSLSYEFNPDELSFIPDETSSIVGNSLFTRIGSLNPHETKLVHLTARINSALSSLEQVITTKVHASLHENDADATDNSETIAIYSGKHAEPHDPGMFSFPAQVTVEKTSLVNEAHPGDTVDFSLIVTNNGGPLYKTKLRDILRNALGATSSEQYWDLGTLKSGETVTINYSVQFGTNIPLGTYLSSSDVFGLDREPTETRGHSYFSKKATHSLLITNNQPEVQGIQTSRECKPLLTTYLKKGVNNDTEEVLRLQKFLAWDLGKPLMNSGIFDNETENAVRLFQSKYANAILAPWGMNQTSGYVYLTTKKMINELSCGTTDSFPLQKNELEEMKLFKQHDNLNSSHTPQALFGDASLPSFSSHLLSSELSSSTQQSSVSSYHSSSTLSFWFDPFRLAKDVSPMETKKHILSERFNAWIGWMRGVALAKS